MTSTKMVFDGPPNITNPSFRQAQNQLTKEELEAKHHTKLEQPKHEAVASNNNQLPPIASQDDRGGYYLTRTEWDLRFTAGVCLRCKGPHRATSCQEPFFPGPFRRKSNNKRKHDWLKIPDPQFDVSALAVQSDNRGNAVMEETDLEIAGGFDKWNPLRNRLPGSTPTKARNSGSSSSFQSKALLESNANAAMTAPVPDLPDRPVWISSSPVQAQEQRVLQPSDTIMRDVHVDDHVSSMSQFRSYNTSAPRTVKSGYLNNDSSIYNPFTDKTTGKLFAQPSLEMQKAKETETEKTAKDSFFAKMDVQNKRVSFVSKHPPPPAASSTPVMASIKRKASNAALDQRPAQRSRGLDTLDSLSLLDDAPLSMIMNPFEPPSSTPNPHTSLRAVRPSADLPPSSANSGAYGGLSSQRTSKYFPFSRAGAPSPPASIRRSSSDITSRNTQTTALMQDKSMQPKPVDSLTLITAQDDRIIELEAQVRRLTAESQSLPQESQVQRLTAKLESITELESQVQRLSAKLQSVITEFDYMKTQIGDLKKMKLDGSILNNKVGKLENKVNSLQAQHNHQNRQIHHNQGQGGGIGQK